MAEERDLATFAAALAEDVRDRALGDSAGAEFTENAFAEIISEHLAEIGMLDNPIVCFHQGRFGAGGVRLNGYAVPDDGERLDLIVALFEGGTDQRTVPTADIVRIGGQAARALQAALRGDHEQMERASDAYAMMHRISELLEGGVREARVFVLTDGLSAARGIEPQAVGNVSVTFEIYDLRRLMRTMATGQTREIIEIDLGLMGLQPIPCVAMPASDGEYESYLAIFPGEALYRMYEEFGPRILEYNVRAFLQATGKVNRGIRDTLRDEPHHFMAYNNGISVTVDEISTEAAADGLKITGFRGLQIVNGGQTTASIHRARKRERLDIPHIHVAAKITRLPPDSVEEMVPKISRFANTQNVIQEADFSANEPYHIAVERLSKTIWAPGERSRWFYERSRGQYRTAMNIEGTTPARMRAFRDRTPPSRRFSKTDLARALNSWSRLPHIVSGGAQKNFIAFMRSLREQRGASWEPDDAYFRDAVAQIILYAAAQRIVRQEGFPAYRANITCYLVAYLSHRTGGRLRLDEIWRSQGISTGLEALLRGWSRNVDRQIQESSAGRNVTEWCKKEGCWMGLRNLDLPVSDPLPPEWGSASAISGGTEPGPVSKDTHAAAATCMRLPAETWFAMHLWGRRTGSLAEWQTGIAHTLSSYASGGWTKSPTHKQATHGVRILEIAREKGFDPFSPTDVARMQTDDG
ncbi:AIPR family protein [Mesorhizobium xinjiangense]|uniref:AIPR family protein n=1 Tax=Mesorhizobium xinjiangense TaxID=2678685 RepID=UPI0012EE3A8F|nr:AIPR family protein [Mesorhizobium xinjiangense]